MEKNQDIIRISKSLPVAIVVIGKKNTIDHINEAVEEITGYTLREVKGKECKLLFGTQCEKKGFLYPHEKTEGKLELSTEVNTKDGEKIPVARTGWAITDETGSITGCVEAFIRVPYDNKPEKNLRKENLNLSKMIKRWQDLMDAGVSLSSSISINRILLRLINILQDTFDFGISAVFMPNETGKLVISAKSKRFGEMLESLSEISDKGLIWNCYKNGQPMLLNDVQLEPDYINANPDIHSELAVPITFDEKVFGVIDVESVKKNFFSAEDNLLLTTLGKFAGTALNNAMLAREADIAKSKYEVLFDKSPDPVLIIDSKNENIIDCNLPATELYGYTKEEFLNLSISILLENKTDGQQMLKARWEGYNLTKDKSKKYIVSNVTTIDYQSVKAFLLTIHDITERKRAEDEIMHLSITDELTSLHNRRYFEEKINVETERSARYEVPLSLMMIDIDKFKNYNDKMGHVKGDKLLTEIGKILQEKTRASDIACRYGGDEFAVILPHTPGDSAYMLGKRIQASFGRAKHDGLSLSIGIAEFDIMDMADEFISKADKALYYVKKDFGRGKISVFKGSNDASA